MAGSIAVLILSGFLQGPPGVAPGGAVLAFDLPDGCPEGWVAHPDSRGRFIVGVGDQKGLTAKPFHQIGGAEEHKLTSKEIPWLSGTVVAANLNEGDKFVWDLQRNGREFQDNTEPHNNMPPFIALYFCKKV